MKLETHCHTLGGSHCADGDRDVFVSVYKNAGYGGVVITNHFSRDSYDYIKGDTKEQKIRYYFSLLEDMKERLIKSGLKCFWGTEVRAMPENGADRGEEFTVYGINEKMMYDNRLLFEFTQKELFEFADKNGLFMYQTHPFRFKVKAGDPKYMHGAEAFNGHYHHYAHNALANAFCENNGLIKMSGTDYHHDGQPITGGIFVPDNIETEEQLISCIFSRNFTLHKDEILYEEKIKEYKEGRIK